MREQEGLRLRDQDPIAAYCLSKKAATEDYPFGPLPLVAKVGGKMFALLSLTAEGKVDNLSLKCDPVIAENLREQHAAVQPGYHLNKKHWRPERHDAKHGIGHMSDEQKTQVYELKGTHKGNARGRWCAIYEVLFPESAIPDPFPSHAAEHLPHHGSRGSAWIPPSHEVRNVAAEDESVPSAAVKRTSSKRRVTPCLLISRSSSPRNGVRLGSRARSSSRCSSCGRNASERRVGRT